MAAVSNCGPRSTKLFSVRRLRSASPKAAAHNQRLRGACKRAAPARALGCQAAYRRP
jgi:hypothetical protein